MPRTLNNDRVVKAYRLALERERQIGFDGLAESERELIATLLMHEEIRNGGFTQWLTNPHSDYAEHAIRFLTRVGDRDRVHLIELASKIFPSGRIPTTWEERRRIASAWTRDDFHRLDPVDRSYYSIKHDIYDDLVSLVPDTIS